MSANDPLIRMNVHFLQQGIDLLQNLTNKQYWFDNSPYFSSSAGKHMRHVIDHYLSLKEGKPSTVDYEPAPVMPTWNRNRNVCMP